MPTPRIVITGSGAICGAGKSPDEIWDALRAGRSAIGPIQQWDAVALAACASPPRSPTTTPARWPAIASCTSSSAAPMSSACTPPTGHRAGGLARAWRDTLDEAAAARFSDRTGVYVGSGGGSYRNQYDFFPLLAAAKGDLQAFGRELAATVNPMWLLRSLPNNVLCHVGIRHGLKGPNACITNHSISGVLAVAEAAAALRAGEADRAVAVGHDAPIEPQTVLYYHQLGLLARDALRPFDAAPRRQR